MKAARNWILWMALLGVAASLSVSTARAQGIGTLSIMDQSEDEGDAFADESDGSAMVDDDGVHFATGGCNECGQCGDVCSPCGDCGGCGSCCRCCPCGPPGRFWLRQEYVGWWLRGGRVPSLVNSSPDGSLPAGHTLYGNSTYNDGYRPGLFTQYGMWLDGCRNWGLQGDYFFVGRQSAPFTASSDGDPVLTRPFFDANTGQASDQLVAFPNTVVGNVSVANYNSLAGVGAFARHNLCCWTSCCNPQDIGCGCGFCGQDCCRVDFLVGFRNFRLNDNLGVNEQLTSIDQTSGTAVGTQFNVKDSFRTQNNYYGCEFGLVANKYRGRWMLEGGARLAVGGTQQIVAINGSTTISYPGQATTVDQGGLLALSSNIGHYKHSQFSVIPQLSGRIGYRVTPRFNLLAGYTVLWWNNVARAGDQVNLNVNPNLIPPVVGGGPNQPAYTLHTSNLWLQGITLGGEFFF